MKKHCSKYAAMMLLMVICMITGCNGKENSDRERAVDYAGNETQGFELYDGFQLYEEDDSDKSFGGSQAPMDADGNYIITNSGEAMTVIISVPAGFEFEKSSMNYVAFSDTVSTKVDFSFVENVTAEQIFETYSSPEFIDSENKYNNINVSELKSMNVNGMEVAYFYIAYECEDGNTCKDYKAWTQIDDKTFLVAASAAEGDVSALGMADSIVEQMFRCVKIGSDL